MLEAIDSDTLRLRHLGGGFVNFSFIGNPNCAGNGTGGTSAPRGDSPNPTVDVVQDENGSLSVGNTDPAPTGQVLEMKFQPADGTEGTELITVPRPPIPGEDVASGGTAEDVTAL